MLKSIMIMWNLLCTSTIIILKNRMMVVLEIVLQSIWLLY
ncbi:unnamed protein product [Angiostrongylus costaricensis]|uniref:Uncharacterized protein n=1 Tax=Angiostrongylus costaricensis TaxID=334426 RepID=A0A0R3PFJ1_ANGCS|nr:unnamed protein product [Angiostrongylus costaricensis]